MKMKKELPSYLPKQNRKVAAEAGQEVATPVVEVTNPSVVCRALEEDPEVAVEEEDRE